MKYIAVGMVTVWLFVVSTVLYVALHFVAKFW